MGIAAEGLALCVDIGGSSTKAGVLSAKGELSDTDLILTKPDAESFCDRLIGLIKKTKAKARVKLQMGVAVAGFLDEKQQHLAYNPNLAWLEGFPLRQRLQENFPDFTIALEVDSNAATMAEYRFGSGQNSRRFLCLTAGTGLGVGMAIDGEPLRFAYGCMGDIGHTIVLRDGPLCACGGRGCAEVLVSSNSLAANYKRLIGAQHEITLRDVIDASRLGDEAAISVLTTAGEWLGVAVASMANTFFPDHIVIAGGLSAAGDIVLKPAERVFLESACSFATSKTTFSRAVLGSSATLIGAAWRFWEEKKSGRMANQSPDRRRVLELIATAAAASQFPGFSRWAFAEPQHDHQTGADAAVLPRAERYSPQFFSADEYRTIETLTELIIPADKSPGAKDAGVSEFIDFMAAHGDRDLQGSMRNGLAPFVNLPSARQEALLQRIAYPSRTAASNEEGHAFFKLIRRYTVMGYYTSRVGLKELDYPGLAFYSASPECPHKDDPEHRHLPLPRS